MKLGEAIRIGAKKRPQCFGHLFDKGGSCALGAAIEALLGKTVGEFSLAEFPTRWRMTEIVRLSITDGDAPLARQINYLNDDQRWTREEIADWVEEIEAKRERGESP